MKEECSSYGAGLLQQLSKFVAPPRTSAVVPRSQGDGDSFRLWHPTSGKCENPLRKLSFAFSTGSEIFSDSVFAPLVSLFCLFCLAFQVCSVVGRPEGVGQKEQKSAIDLVGSPRLLYLSFHCTIHIRDKIERSPERNSGTTLYASH